MNAYKNSIREYGWLSASPVGGRTRRDAGDATYPRPPLWISNRRRAARSCMHFDESGLCIPRDTTRRRYRAHPFFRFPFFEHSRRIVFFQARRDRLVVISDEIGKDRAWHITRCKNPLFCFSFIDDEGLTRKLIVNAVNFFFLYFAITYVRGIAIAKHFITLVVNSLFLYSREFLLHQL